MATGATAMGRGNWTNASNQTLNQSSYVNVGVQGVIDAQSRQLTVTVEVYYTGNSPVSTNKLNIALLQNNTLGPQTGGNMGNNYNHMHRLVHMITGQWELISLQQQTDHSTHKHSITLFRQHTTTFQQKLVKWN